MNIKVVDSLMGTGKTTAIINMINKSDNDEKFFFVTQYLDEVKRIKEACSEKKFKEPQLVNGKKIEGLKRLLTNKQNIVTTHSLFHYFDEEVMELIKTYGYTLIMDEVSDVVHQYGGKHNADNEYNFTKEDRTVGNKVVSAQDFQMLLDDHWVHIDDKGFVVWDNLNYDNGRFTDFKALCEIGSLCVYGETIILWLMPIKCFECFNDVYILTYMFDGQEQKWYYDYFGASYEYYKAIQQNSEYVIVKGHDETKIDRSLINICYHEKLNTIGERETAFSKCWYITAIKNKLTDTIKRNVQNYCRNISGAKSSDILWTTFKDFKRYVSDKGYTKGFIPINSKATNQYRDRNTLVYLYNCYENPVIIQFFRSRNIEIDEISYATSIMLQWIWRSAIREGKPINIYIPSKRMRKLLEDWILEHSIKASCINNFEEHSA